MKTPVPPLHRSRFAWLLARPWATHLIATLGIVLMTIGLTIPVAGREVLLFDGLLHDITVWSFGDGVHALFMSVLVPRYVSPDTGRMPLLLQLGSEAVYAVLTLGGLALLPLLWQSLSRKGTVLARSMYAVWLVLLIVLAVACFPAWHTFMSQPPLGSPEEDITLAESYLLAGAVVFPLGVLLSGAALALMLKEPLPAEAPASAHRAGWQWAAALVLTAGVLVWGIGFYLMPQVITTECPPVIFSVTQFARGACAGLDSDQVLAAAHYANLHPVIVMLFNFEFLVAAACITALGGWTRQLSVKTLAWLAAWPVLALVVALVALQGVGVIVQHGFKLTIETGPNWHVGPGMIVTFAGIGLVALGQFGLWRELVRWKAGASAQ